MFGRGHVLNSYPSEYGVFRASSVLALLDAASAIKKKVFFEFAFCNCTNVAFFRFRQERFRYSFPHRQVLDQSDLS